MTARTTCSTCRRSRRMEFHTDGNGHVLEVTPPCPWCAAGYQPCPEPQEVETPFDFDQDRRGRGICQLCDEPVDGLPKRAVYCARHREEAKRETWNRARAKKDPTGQITSKFDDERRLHCICQLCDEPTDGKPKVALYCAKHRAQQKKERSRRTNQKFDNKYSNNYRAAHREELNRKARDKARERRARLRAECNTQAEAA